MTRTICLVAVAVLALGGIGAQSPPGGAQPPMGIPPQPIPPKQWAVGAIAVATFSPDGKWILTGDNTTRVSLRGVDADQPTWSTVLTTKRNPRHHDWRFSTLGVAFAADGKRVFAAWGEAVVELDREKGTILRTTPLPRPVNGWDASAAFPLVAFLPGSDECVYLGDDSRLVRFDFRANKLHSKFNLQLPRAGHVEPVISPDGKRVLVCGQVDDGALAAEWDLETKAFGGTFVKPEQGFSGAGYTADGEQVWVWVDPVTVFDRRTGKRVALPGVLKEYHRRLWFSPGGKHALGLLETHKEMEVIRLADGEVLHRFSIRGLFHDHLGLVVFSPDGKMVLLSGWVKDGEWGGPRWATGLWEVATGKHLRTIKV